LSLDETKAGLASLPFLFSPTMSSVKEKTLALLGAAAWIAASVAFAELPVVELSAGIHLIRAELANTFETRAQGLMFRKHLGPNEGMFFVFPQSEPHCMWMKNTLIPLSVAFVDEKGKIVSISDMQPQTETSHCAAAPAKFALEMPAGWFAKKGIKSGTTIQGLEKTPAAR
jgi:uncharacterized membrane protein (UPF0127 family)